MQKGRVKPAPCSEPFPQGLPLWAVASRRAAPGLPQGRRPVHAWLPIAWRTETRRALRRAAGLGAMRRTGVRRTLSRRTIFRRPFGASRWPVSRRAFRTRPVSRRTIRPAFIIVMPAVAVAIERTVAVIAIPIGVKAEPDEGNAERRVIFRTDIDPPLLIECLQISSGNPSANTPVGGIAPGRASHTTVYRDRRTGRDNRHDRITGTRPCPEVDCCDRKSLRRKCKHWHGKYPEDK